LEWPPENSLGRLVKRRNAVSKEDEIRLIAYNIWEQEGCINGKDCENWFRAEAIWQGQQKLFSIKTTTVLEPPIHRVPITPPPTRVELLSSPVKKSVRARNKKKK
jgi:hypothetical protein